MAPIEINLKVKAFVAKEGSQWVIVCPALCFAVQGRTLVKARSEFRLVMRSNLDDYQKRGVLAEVMRLALEDEGFGLAKIGKAETFEIPLESPMFACASSDTPPGTAASVASNTSPSHHKATAPSLTPPARNRARSHRLKRQRNRRRTSNGSRSATGPTPASA